MDFREYYKKHSQGQGQTASTQSGSGASGQTAGERFRERYAQQQQQQNNAAKAGLGIGRAVEMYNRTAGNYNSRIGQWQSQEDYAAWNRELTSRSAALENLRKSYEQNRASYSDKDYADIMSQLDELRKGYSQMAMDSRAANIVNRQFNNADDYNIALAYTQGDYAKAQQIQQDAARNAISQLEATPDAAVGPVLDWQRQKISGSNAINEDAWYQKYGGKSAEEIQSAIDELTESGRTWRKAGDDEYTQLLMQMQGDQEDWRRRTLISKNEERDNAWEHAQALEQEIKRLKETHEVEGENANAAEIAWMQNYLPYADYNIGRNKYGADLMEMTPYEVISWADDPARTDEERAWAEDYMAGEMNQQGQLGLDEYRETAEAQRVYDQLQATMTDEQKSAYDEAVRAQKLSENGSGRTQEEAASRLSGFIDEYARLMGISHDEAAEQVKAGAKYSAHLDTQESRARMQEFGSAHPYASSALSVALQPAANIRGRMETTAAALAGQDARSYDTGIRMFQNNQAIRQSAGQYFGEVAEKNGMSAENGQWIYNTVMSAADSAVNMLLMRGAGAVLGAGAATPLIRGESAFAQNILRPVSSFFGMETLGELAGQVVSNAVMGSGAAVDSYISYRQKGYSNEQALMAGIVAGAIEGITEAVGGERIWSAIFDEKRTLSSLLLQFNAEGTEEYIGNILNDLFASAYLQDEEARQRMDDRLAFLLGSFDPDMKHADAFQRALTETVLAEDVSAYLAGGLSALISTGAGRVIRAGSTAFGDARTGRQMTRQGYRNAGNISEINRQLGDLGINAQVNENSRGYALGRAVRLATEGRTEANVQQALDELEPVLREELAAQGISGRMIERLTGPMARQIVSAALEQNGGQVSRRVAEMLSVDERDQKLLDSKRMKAAVESITQGENSLRNFVNVSDTLSQNPVRLRQGESNESTASAAASTNLEMAAAEQREDGTVSHEIADAIWHDAEALAELAEKTGVEITDGMSAMDKRSAVKRAVAQLVREGSTTSETVDEDALPELKGSAAERSEAQRSIDAFINRRSTTPQLAAAIQANYDGQSEAAPYLRDMYKVYTAAVRNLSGAELDAWTDGIQLTDDAYMAAWEAGQSVARGEDAAYNESSNEQEETGNAETESERQSDSTERERSADEYGGGEDGRLAARTAETEERRSRGEEERRAARRRDLAVNAKVAQGEVIPDDAWRSWDDSELNEIAADAESNGVTVHYVNGQYEATDPVTGRTVLVNGMFSASGKEVWLNVTGNRNNFTARQLYDHENTHKWLDENGRRERLDSFRDRMLATQEGRTRLRRAVRDYAYGLYSDENGELPSWAVDENGEIADEMQYVVLEELFCNVRSGMDYFRADPSRSTAVFTDTVDAVMREEANGVRQTNGPNAEAFSRELEGEDNGEETEAYERPDQGRGLRSVRGERNEGANGSQGGTNLEELHYKALPRERQGRIRNAILRELSSDEESGADILQEFGTDSLAEELYEKYYIENAHYERLEEVFPYLRNIVINAASEDYATDGKTGIASWTPERISTLYSLYSVPDRAFDRDYAKAYATRMSPGDFLSLTAGDREQAYIEMDTASRYGALNEEGLRSDRHGIYLVVDMETGEVVGHEGRHRMTMLRDAGIESVPVVIQPYEQGDKYHRTAIPSMRLTGQTVHNAPGIVDVENVLPLSNNYKNEVISAFGGEGDIRFSRELDAEYLELAKDPEKNATRLQEMVDEAAEAALAKSEIRDEDGKLLKVYHGTDANFTVFDRTKGRSTMDIQGSFFSPWDIDAGGYGSNVRAFYLNIENPAPEGTAYRALNAFKGRNNAGVLAREQLEDAGYDGVNNSDEEYIAFNPNQVKSADPVTYDDSGNVIPLSERFNTENDDIRFSRELETELKERFKEYERDETNLKLAVGALSDLRRFEEQGKINGRGSDEYTRDAGRAGELGQVRAERRQIRTIGRAISTEFIQKGFVDLRGRRVRNADELAQLCQCFRDPRFETFRLILTKGNKIVSVHSISSRLPGSAPASRRGQTLTDYAREIEKRMKRTGADGYYLMHNHPSGNVQASGNDIRATSSFIDLLGEDGYRGHVILDHDQYGYIAEAPGSPLPKAEIRPLNQQISIDWLHQPSIEHPLLGEGAIGAGQIAALGKQIQSADDASVLLYCTADLRVNEIQEVMNSTLLNNREFGNYIRNEAVESGSASSAALYTTSREVYDGSEDLLRRGILFDVILETKDGKGYISMRNESAVLPQQDSAWNDQEVDRRTRAYEPRAQYSGDDGARFSREIETQSFEEIRQENEELRKKLSETMRTLKRREGQLETAKAEVRRTSDAPVLRARDVSRMAGDLLKRYDSKLEKASVAQQLRELGEYILRGDADEGVAWTEVKDRATDIARDVIENAKEITDSGFEYGALKAHLKWLKIYFPKEYRPDVTAWSDDWQGFMRSLHGRIHIVSSSTVQGATSMDAAYQEMQGMFGTGIFPEDITHPADQLMRLVEVVESFRPVYENPYSYDMAAAIENVSNEIIDGLLGEDVRQKHTYADRAHEAMQRLRVQRDNKIAAIREHYRESNARQRAKRDLRLMQDRLLKKARMLDRMGRATTPEDQAVIRELIGDLDLAAKSITQKTVDKLEALRDWYNDKVENDPDFIPDERTEKTFERLSKKRISDLSVEELSDLTDAINNCINEIRTRNKLLAIEDRRTTQEMGTEIIRDVENSVGMRPTGMKAAWDRIVTNDTLSPERQIRRLIGYNDEDPLLRATQALSDGQRESFDYTRRANALVQKWVDDKDFISKIAGKDAEAIEITGLTTDGQKTVKITPAMRMSLYLHALNSQNMRHIAGGGITVPDFGLYTQGKIQEAFDRAVTIRLTKSQVASIVSRMSEEEKAFARAVSGYFNGMSKDSINAKSILLKGYEIARVQNYFPINTDPNFTKKDLEAIKFDGTIEGIGSLKERVNATNPILLEDMTSVLNRSIKQHAKYVGLAVPVRNFNKLYGVGSWQRGPVMYNDLVNKPDMRITDVREDTKGADYAKLKRDALSLAETSGWFDAPFRNEDTGADIFLTKNSYTHAFSNLRSDFGEDTILAMKHIPEIIENAVLTDRAMPKDQTKAETEVLTFFGALRGNGGIEPVKLTVKVYDGSQTDRMPQKIREYYEKNGTTDRYNRLYDAKALEVLSVERATEKETDASASGSAQNTEAKGTSVSTKISIAELLGLVNGEARKYIPDRSVPAAGGAQSVQQMLRAKWGSSATSYIEKLLADVQNGKQNEDSLIARLLRTSRSRYASAVLMLNWGVAVKQAASYPTAAAVLGYKPLAQALASTEKVDTNLIAKYTPLYWYRAQGFSTQELGDLVTQNRQIPQWLNWIQGMDLATTRKLWLASEMYVRDNQPGLKRGSDDYFKAVSTIYNRVIEETQPNYTTMQRPQILRSQNELTRTLNMFRTQPFQNFNILYDAIGNWRAKAVQYQNLGTPGAKQQYEDARKRAVLAVSSQLASSFVFALMQFAVDAFRGKLKKYKDKEDDEVTLLSWMKGMGLNMLANAGGMIPYGGVLLEWLQSTTDKVLKAMDKEPFFDQSFYGLDDSIVETLNGVANGTQDALATTAKMLGSWNKGEKVDWETTLRKYYSDAAKICQVLGLPLNNVKNLVEAVVANIFRTAHRGMIGEYEALRITTNPASDKKSYYDLLYRAMKEEPESYGDILESMTEGGQFKEDTVRSQMKTRVGEDYAAGRITETEATVYLVRYLGYNLTDTGSNSVKYQLDKWSADGDFSIATRWDAAFRSGGAAVANAVAAIQKDYNYTDEGVKSSFRDYCKKQYEAATNGSEKQKIKRFMIASGLYTESEALDQFRRWEESIAKAADKEAAAAEAEEEARRRLPAVG